ncbi:cyanobactin biosynthesis PatC/TenC/TruC family protein [Nocardia sp. NPDC050408]|uniref:cyanobactin biosynthesis PatC/TenC/TruC family protein n=1 Tax=unclassified Nocardia TaxID=2637762 RepID=UPI003430E725
MPEKVRRARISTRARKSAAKRTSTDSPHGSRGSSQSGAGDAFTAITTPHPLQTGLSDYAIWVSMFMSGAEAENDPSTYRRGRVWA